MDGGGTGSVLVASGSTVTLANLTLTHGSGSGPDLPGERSGDYGGGISVTGSKLTVVRCRIVRNSAEQGGGIHAAKATVKIVGSLVAGNTTSDGGGGIDTEDDVDLTINRSTISGNSTRPHGGGIEAFDGSATLPTNLERLHPPHRPFVLARLGVCVRTERANTLRVEGSTASPTVGHDLAPGGVTEARLRRALGNRGCVRSDRLRAG
jgi:hypothetical protein